MNEKKPYICVMPSARAKTWTARKVRKFFSQFFFVRLFVFPLCKIRKHGQNFKATELSDNQLWWTGPDFSKKSPEFWPNILNFRSAQTPSDEIAAEVNKAVKLNPRKDFSNVFVNTVTSLDLNVENVISCENHSSTKHSFRVTAYVIRFVQNLKRRVKGEDCVIGKLSLEEFLDAKNLWFR